MPGGRPFGPPVYAGPRYYGGPRFVENVFVLPGVGRLIFQAVANRDTLVVADAAMALAMLVIGVSFVVDLACAFLDPRWRLASP